MTLTPEQFNKLATKEDLEDLRNEMTTKAEHNQVMDVLDMVVKKLDTIEHGFVSNMAAHNRYEEAINNLNIRVERLEKINNC